MHENEIAKQIVDAALRVHTALGPGPVGIGLPGGFVVRTGKAGTASLAQQVISVVYESLRIGTGFYADLVVENKVIVEIKVVRTVAPCTRCSS